MDEIVLKDFRCFHEEQTARLAPLTVLVGDNSTGKTSFLVLIRALWDALYKQHVPNFKEEPYDLGTFPEIAHCRGAGGGCAKVVEAEFKVSRIKFRMRLKAGRSAPIACSCSVGDDSGNEVSETFDEGAWRVFRLTTRRGSWAAKIPKLVVFDRPFAVSMADLCHMLATKDGFRRHNAEIRPLGNSPRMVREDRDALFEVLSRGGSIGEEAPVGRGAGGRRMQERPVARAPARSKPRRIYELSSLERDAEGDDIPVHLALLRARDPDRWKSLKKQIEDFGKSAGLFDEINIKPLGAVGGTPFQIQVRKYAGVRKNAVKGPQRNLIDVGYGVSQVLPVIADLLRRDSPSLFLLQQPEAHLHPSAQAALGDLFCKAAGPKGHQIVVETHSDYLLDRIRMAIRHGTTKLGPEDISILFFERQGLSVQIHSLRLDARGSIENAPPAYRRFFMEEIDRRLDGFKDVRDT